MGVRSLRSLGSPLTQQPLAEASYGEFVLRLYVLVLAASANDKEVGALRFRPLAGMHAEGTRSFLIASTKLGTWGFVVCAAAQCQET